MLLAFLSELLGTISGVSSSSIFVPLAAFVEPVKITLALTAVMHVIGNSTRLFLYWKNIDWKLAIKFGIPSALMTALGAEYSDILPEGLYLIFLGLLLLTISSYILFSKSQFSSSWISYVAGGLSGLLTGLLGSGGALRSLALTNFNLGPMIFTGTSTLIDFGGDIFRLIIYLKKDYLSREHYFYIPILVIVTFIANKLAKRWLEKVDKEKFKKITLKFVIVMGFVSVVNGIIKLADL